MLSAIIRTALHYRLLVLVISGALLVYGAFLATTLPVDVFPDLDRPRVIIITECPGLATEEVETLVTQPIEIALLGANGVQAVRSQSTASLTVVYVEFDWSIDIRYARQTVQERLATVTLPANVHPQMTPPSSIMGQIVIAGIYRQRGPSGGQLAPLGRTGLLAELVNPADDTSPLLIWRPTDRHDPAAWESIAVEKFTWEAPSAPHATQHTNARRAVVVVQGVQHTCTFESAEEQNMALRTLADWVVRPQLLKVTGVAEVFIQGGERKQYQILVDPTALLEYGVTLHEVEQALTESNINTSGGFATRGETERPIRVLGR